MATQLFAIPEKDRHGFQPRYSQLKSAGIAEFIQAGRDELVIRNRVSALATFMKHLRRVDADVVGQEFGVDFDKELMRWCDDMRDRGMSSRTIEDRCGFLALWRDSLMRLSQTDTLPEEFSEALSESMKRKSFSFKALARATGIGYQAIADWASGTRRPARDVAGQIAKLEAGLLLPAGTLSKRLGFVIERYRVTKAARAQTDALTTYGRRLRAQYHATVRLNYLKAPHENVRREWHQLIAHKINEFRPRASKRDTWRVKSEAKTGAKANWASVYPGGRVAAADAAWGYLSRYLSWLCLEEEHGGAGVSAERVSTLAWVIKNDLFQRCLQWVRMRSGGILHAGQAQMLNYAAMLLRPGTGWLWLNFQVVHAFASRDLPIDIDLPNAGDTEIKDRWQAECARVWALYKSQAENVMSSKNLQQARDPREPINDILSLPRPLATVMTMLATLKKNPPPVSCTKSRAVWLRDVLLISFLSANPLRAQHFSTMTYRSNNSGNLYKNGDVWHYRATASEFKNSPGDYDVTLPRYVGDAIEDYFRDGRQHLYLQPGSDYVFMPSRCGPQTSMDATGTVLPDRPVMWTTEAVGIRVRLITRGLRNGLPGFGPHAFRHIVATDYLKRNPGAYQMVAHLLNDTLDTVIREYGHVSPQDGLELHYQSATEELSHALGGSNVTGDGR